jgi:hypothetical protein
MNAIERSAATVTADGAVVAAWALPNAPVSAIAASPSTAAPPARIGRWGKRVQSFS